MSTFKNMCHRTQAFRRLRSITLTVDIRMSVVDWTQNIDRLLGTAPLEAFQLYPTNIFGDIPIPDDFWRSIVTTHGSRLKCFSVHRMQLSLTVLRSICSQCPRVEQLFVVLCQGDLTAAAPLLALAENLRTLHIIVSWGAQMSLATMMKTALFITSHCSSTLTQIGLNTQVWQVQRTVFVDENGEKYTLPSLVPRENPEIPEQFLVIRV